MLTHNNNIIYGSIPFPPYSLVNSLLKKTDDLNCDMRSIFNQEKWRSGLSSKVRKSADWIIHNNRR